MPLPFAVVDHLPLLDDILPARINFLVDALVAALVAFGLDDVHAARYLRPRPLHRRSPNRAASLVGVLAVFVVVVTTQLPDWPLTGQFAAVPTVALPPDVRSVVPAGDPITITYPYASNYDTTAMLWQVQDGLRFRLLGGYAYRPGALGRPTLVPPVMHPGELQQFLAAQGGDLDFGPPLPLGPELTGSTRRTVVAYGIRLVIVDRTSVGSGSVIDLFAQALGPPRLTDAGYVVWTPGVKLRRT